MKIFCFYCFLFFYTLSSWKINGNIGAENNDFSKDGYKYQLSVCAIFTNEASCLDGWIKYHRILGVDHFYLYNLGSYDSFHVILKPYISEGIVTLVNWPEIRERGEPHTWALSSQIPAYENAVNFLARGETKWLILLDICEFLVCSHASIAELLKDYEGNSGISLFTEVDDKVRKITFSKNKPADPSTKRGKEENGECAEKSVAKIIFKPDQCAGFTWPPYQCCLRTSPPHIEAKQLKVVREVGRKKSFFLLNEKSKNQYGDKQSLLLVDEVYMQSNKEEAIDDCCSQIYGIVPEFLKKLKSEIN